MKSASAIVLGILVTAVVLFASTRASAAPSFCDDVPEAKWIKVNFPLNAKATIKNALTNYMVMDGALPKYLVSKDSDEAYCLVFQVNPAIGSQINFTEELSLTLADDHDVYIKGLNIAAPNNLPFLLRLRNNSESRKVVLLDSTLGNIQTGITTEGTGRVEMHHVSINGNAQAKTGACIDIATPNAFLDDVNAAGCGEGIRVGANGLVLTSSETASAETISEVRDNKVGIHILGGIIGTDIGRTKIYGNNDGNGATADGIRFEDGAPDGLVFYDGEGEDIAPLDESPTGVFDYEERPVYIYVPLPTDNPPEGDIRIEFFIKAEADCYKINCDAQIKEILSDQYEVKAAAPKIVKTPVEHKLPSSAYGKNLVAIYTDPQSGTTGFSQSFKAAADTPIVIYVSTPFDMTTQGADGPADVGSGDGGSTGSDLQSGGDGGVMGAGASPKCSLIIDRARITWGSAFAWLILLWTAPAAGLVVIRTRVRRR